MTLPKREKADARYLRGTLKAAQYVANWLRKEGKPLHAADVERAVALCRSLAAARRTDTPLTLPPRHRSLTREKERKHEER